MVKKTAIVGLLVLVAFASVGLGREIVVTNTDNSGTRSFRWALQTARSGDTITFDPAVFPSDDPATILVKGSLPSIRCGSLTIDASDAGVVLSGSLLRGGEVNGLEILSSGNTVHGLQILDFSGSGIFLADRAQENTIGGDPAIGKGPFGQGNAIGRCNCGVGIWGRLATRNTVLGNIIGTDVAGNTDFGNIDGIGLGDGTTRNSIGPDNTIAHNRESGVLVLGGDTSGNTITRNSIHSNGWAGIRFEETDPGETNIVLDEADLTRGRLTGHACANCVLEFFSDTGSQGRVFEARASTDDEGRFELTTSTPLLGPILTVTATDRLGTTGRFFEFLHVLESGERLQQGSDQLAIALVTRRFDELEDNRLGQLASLTSDVHSPADAEGFVNQHVELGLTWYRISLDWLDWCEVVESPRFSSEAVDPNADAAITMLVDHGVSVMLDLVYWDDRISVNDPPTCLYSTGAEIDRYVDYVRAIVRHFRGRVASYALLNEPNVPDPGQFVAASDYVELVRHVVPIIREEDPEAKIVIGEITPLWGCDGLHYLFALLDSNILPMIDGIVWHWGGASPEYQGDFYYGYPELVREIRQIAKAGDFAGELLAEEISLRTTKTPHPSEYMGYEETPALKYTTRIVLTNLGLDLAAGLGFENLEEIPLQVHLVQNLCTVMAGHEAIDMPVEIDVDYAGPVAYCTFRYPNGDLTLAVWTDGVAHDDDPGVPATITFPGLTAGTVTGIDVLHGFEQKLIFETDGDNTIVRDLLVKDYPIFIRLRDVTMGSGYEETVGDGFHRLGEIPGPAVWIVKSTADSGTGTLRWALQTARSGESITFDPVIFPPDDPAMIRVTSMLPILTQGNLTIDASNAGVILDGSGIREENAWYLEIPSSGNTIQGLQIVNFGGAGIQLVGGAQHNTIGGDRTTGSGPVGQGNLCSGNSGGICLWDEGTSYNTITGNLIGTDVTGTEPFGNIDGMFLSDGASNNTIGPNNVIAYNREHAIIVQGSNSLGNRITANSIHSNEWGGIELLEGGNNELSPPLITSFDRIAGVVSGIACPNGTVEIFSDSDNQGEHFEGATLADETGNFQFIVENADADQYLTATATASTGDTSVFSQPAPGTGREAIIQAGNTFPRVMVQERSSKEAVGDQLTTGLLSGLWQPFDYDKILETEIVGLGSHPARLAVNSLDSISVNWQEPEWPISDRSDAWMSALADNGISIRYGLSFWDKEGYAAGSPAPCERFTTEQDIQRYLEFVRRVVTHFADRVDSFGLWNEPDVERCWQYIPVEQYIELVRRTVPVLRELAPEAEVVIGSTTPFVKDINCGGYEYLMALVESDAVALADAIAWHAGAPSPQFDDWREVYENYPALTRVIVETARANGFDGRFIADELNWRSTLNPHPYGAEPWAYTPTTAAKYYARGALMNLGLGFDIGFAGLSSQRETVFETVKNLCLVLEGVEAVRLPVEIGIDYQPVAYCSFRYPNGDRILAVWTDGIAQDEDPGVLAMITFPGLTAETITGIDVLHGFEQELVFEVDGDNTVIRELLVKDYPILIRLSSVTMGPDYEERVGDGFHRLGDVNAVQSSPAGGSDRDGDGVPDDEDYCPDWPGSKEANGC